MCVNQVEHGRAIGFAAVITELGFLCMSSVATPYERGLDLRRESTEEKK